MSYEQLVGILKDIRQIWRDDQQRPLVECPFDGKPLEFKDGVANCPLGNFRSRLTKQEAANRGAI